MPFNGWNSWTYYDPMVSEESVCITGYTGRGAYWAKAPLAAAGRSRRAQADEMRDRITAAIERDDQRIANGEAATECGEVSIAEPTPARATMQGRSGRRNEDQGIW